jgi:hypothetical protein
MLCCMLWSFHRVKCLRLNIRNSRPTSMYQASKHQGPVHTRKCHTVTRKGLRQT